MEGFKMGKSADQKMREIVYDLKREHQDDGSGAVRVSYNQLRSAIEKNVGRNPRTVTKYVDYMKRSRRLEEIELEESNGYAFEIDTIEMKSDKYEY